MVKDQKNLIVIFLEPTNNCMGQTNRKDQGTLNLSQGLERYVSVLDTHTLNSIFQRDLISFANKLINVEIEEIEKSGNGYVKDERKKELIFLY